MWIITAFLMGPLARWSVLLVHESLTLEPLSSCMAFFFNLALIHQSEKKKQPITPTKEPPVICSKNTRFMNFGVYQHNLQDNHTTIFLILMCSLSRYRIFIAKKDTIKKSSTLIFTYVHLCFRRNMTIVTPRTKPIRK